MAGHGDPADNPSHPLKVQGPCAAAPRAPLVVTPAWGPRGPKPALRLAGAAPKSLPGGADAPLARLPLRNYDHPRTRGGFWGPRYAALRADFARRQSGATPASGVEIEIRPVFEAEDFGAGLTPELRAQNQRLREDMAKRKSL